MGAPEEAWTTENGPLLALVSKGYTGIGVDRGSVCHIDRCIGLSMD